MDVKGLAKMLGTLKVPVAYNHFKKTESNPVPNPPFIVYLEEDSDNFGADNKVWKKILNYRFEVYTDQKDLELESKIEELLDSNDIYYETDESFIVQENLYMRIYYVTLIK